MTRADSPVVRFLLATLLACSSFIGIPAAVAAASVDDATLVGSTSTPVSREFVIPVAGRYELQISDVGFPIGLNRLQAAITKGAKSVIVITAPGTVEFDAVAGVHELQVAGVASSATGLGSFAARVVPVPAGSVALDYSDVIETPGSAPPAGQFTLQTQFTVTEAGPHRITLSDLSFPAKLASVAVLVTRGGVEFARLDATQTTADFAGTPGAYDILAVAQAETGTLAGLFAVEVVNVASSVKLFDSSYPVGRLSSAGTVMLPAAAGYTIGVSDLQFPVALGSAAATLVRGAEVLATAATGESTAFNATAGPADLYALPTPTAQSAVGAMSVGVLQGTTQVFSSVYVASPPASSSETSVFAGDFTLAAAGAFRATMTDFDFPTAFANLQLGVFQNGTELGRRAGAGTLDLQATAGPATVLVAATPGTSPSSGLYGVQVAASPAGGIAYEITRVAGALFEQRSISIATAGSYDVTLLDLEFPVRFSEFATAITRGTEKVGFVFGGGKFSFAATPGEYFLTFITEVDPAETFGTYGLVVENTPPAPTITLTASPTSVQSGESTTLTWTTSNTASCVASGQWTGSKATSGSQAIGPLTVESTFTLTCTGPGGSTVQSVVVGLRSSSGGGGGGGGGGSDPWTLIALIGWAALAGRGRRLSALRQ